MSYTVLARRYRSRDFDEVVGQDAIAQTLQRAVEGDRVAHAYLFCGTRGVGKTTMARIFARALNVSADLADADEIGQAIMRGDDLDVIEIDGASNRGVQEARDLIAASGLSPARCPYRIYIIDEVHMLTTESFNTLLKTMEEPPEHVKFILCTTEPHKVLATIQSRCQRFDFKPIRQDLIIGHLRRILEQEGVEAEGGVLHLVAELGAGSMRDALSVMDRLLSAGDTTLTVEAAQRMLGVPECSLVSDVIAAIGQGDAGAALAGADRLLRSGTSLEQALEALTERFRRMLVLTSCGPDSDVLDLADEDRRALNACADMFDAPALVHAMAACQAASRQARSGGAARAVFDATMARLALASDLIEPATVAEPLPETKKKRAPAPEPEDRGEHVTSSPRGSDDEAVASSKTQEQEASPEPPTDAEPDPTPATLDETWAALCQASAGSKAVKAALEALEPVSLNDGELVIRGHDNVVPAMIVERLEVLAAGIDGPVRIRVEGAQQTRTTPDTVNVVDDPRVDVARSLFDAEVVDTQPKGERGV